MPTMLIVYEQEVKMWKNVGINSGNVSEERDLLDFFGGGLTEPEDFFKADVYLI